jgi:hypothetical protein
MTVLIIAGFGAPEVRAQDLEHEEDEHAHEGLHFTHPLIAESVTPDTKIRLDHQLLDLPDGDKIHVGNLEAEYTFSRSFSIEAGLPYSYTDSDFGNLEVALKFANFEFEDSGVILGYGIEFGFPTAGEVAEEEEPLPAVRSGSLDGSPLASFRASSQSSSGGGIGEAEWEIAPFLNIGLKTGKVELAVWGFVEVPFSQEVDEEVETEIGYNLSALYHVSTRFDALMELDGAGGISGGAVGEDVVNLSPGISFRPKANGPVRIGTSVGIPLTNQEQFSTRWTTSLFWHF